MAADARQLGCWQFIVGTRLALPERAAALSLRPQVLAARMRAPHGDVDAVAEIAAGEAAAGMLGGRIEGRGMIEAAEIGGLRDDPDLSKRLQTVTAELDRLRNEAAAPTAKITRMVPKIAESYRALVADLGNVALADVGRARADLRRLYGGDIRVRPSVKGDYLEALVPSGDRLIELALSGLGFKGLYKWGCGGAAIGSVYTCTPLLVWNASEGRTCVRIAPVSGFPNDYR